jgi:hypothetical protein
MHTVRSETSGEPLWREFFFEASADNVNTNPWMQIDVAHPSTF